MNRRGFLGGSDAKRIMEGDWLPLYLEKTGQIEPENLDHNFKVQLGKHTEQFHLDWIAKYEGLEIQPARNRLHHPKHTMLTALLDGLLPAEGSFVDTKHGTGFISIEDYAEMYQPQIGHYCIVLGCDYGKLSVIRGNEPPEIIKVQPSKAYLEELLEHELRFWWHVTEGVAPEIIPTASLERTVKVAGKQVILDDMRTVDMAGSNSWAEHAADYILFEESSKKFDAAKKGLKELVPDDVRQASGNGITIKRDKAGSLRFSKDK